MLAKVKFCGMTRREDAALAAEIGATYIGVVFADGPRKVSPADGRDILDGGGDRVRRVGVFGTNDPDTIAHTAVEARLDVVQLHADASAADVKKIRSRFSGQVWAAIRIAGSHIPSAAESLFDTADAIVLDARSETRLGGTGEPLPWSDLAADLARDRGSAAVVLAGGLKPGNVVSAIRTLAPDVVDVSSGIESSPGVKDPWLMREFYAAATGLRAH
ncbi:MAG: phosphoribosylanthranilate isomerase [Gemmatimonadaceae bacterium]